MDTAKRAPIIQFHPKTPGGTPERIERAIGSIPYYGPVLPTDLSDSPPPDEPTKRARD